MSFAHKCGFRKLLVLSGITSEDTLLSPGLAEEFLPDYYANSLADFIDFFEKN
jgi:ribonucleotide monophosphatase NagD (HAD superfamily)